MAGIVDAVRDLDGAPTRVVAELGPTDFSIAYARDDVEAQYSQAQLEEAYRLIMAKQVAGEDFEAVIGREFDAQLLFFEDIVVFVKPGTRYEAVFASFDRREDFPADELVDIATDQGG
ncbi:hypothetical protein [Halobellus ruber]|uniref:Roadblock/LC7 domain-containing protein n=1 Tax=Halobellus ruber TaxID=2761102 RepID=A0A7J9SFZ3_9EURY|nr:hypothetical protein [Halobellus ruber]MBB6645638.1 hypothetical protein [Halobellus ruber]